MTDQSTTADAVDDQPPQLNNPASWHYSVGGERKGPVSDQTIRQMLDRKELNPDSTQVWRKGMTEWKALRTTELAAYLSASDDPPPVAHTQISNGYAWAMAALPLIVLFIEATVEYHNYRAVVGAFTGRGASDLWSFPKGLFGVAFTAAAFLDLRLLQKAGYKDQLTLAMKLFAFFLQPIYLFKRARLLNQKPTYAIAWIVSLVLGLIYLSQTPSF